MDATSDDPDHEPDSAVNSGALALISDTPVIGRRIDVVANGNMNYRYEAMRAAADGRLRASVDEGYSAAWPYKRPADEQLERWWNGFLYSSWQLLDLHHVLVRREWLRHGLDRVTRIGPIEQRRKRTLALAALAPRYLPGILGKLSVPPGMDEHELQGFRFESDVLGLLQAVGFGCEQLKDEAEDMLHDAHARDPLSKWLPLIRHANYSAWSKLQGEPLDCLWLRAGAEVLLRAHEDLAAAGHLEPLPDVSGLWGWSPLHDRLSRTKGAEPLDRVLGSFGLSPHPRVLLLVEGETELLHLPQLLAAFNLTRPEQVRVQQFKGSKISPQLLARYAISPRLGREFANGWLLAATPTALVIAVDAENKWKTQEDRDSEREKIQNAIREEVALQGGRIGQRELDFLINIYVWGDQKYELANFTDEELIPVLAELVSGPAAEGSASAAWCERLADQLLLAREQKNDIKTVIGPIRVKKTALAKALLSLLLAKCEHELAEDTVKTPVLKVVLEVRRLVALLSSGSYMLPSSSGEDSPGHTELES